MTKSHLYTTLKAPEKHKNIPDKAQWLAGEGAGSWFVIFKTDKKLFYKIERYSPLGKLECQGIFSQDHNSSTFNFYSPFSFTHLSHCAEVSILQDGVTFKFIRFSDS